MPHYMMDCYMTAIDDLRPTESLRVGASSDSEAIREAQQICVWKRPARFKLRSVSRSGDRIIHDSRSETSACLKDSKGASGEVEV